MFNNAGDKIKMVAKVLFWLGVTASIIWGIILFSIVPIRNYWTFLYIILQTALLCFGSWIGSLVLYGFGVIVSHCKDGEKKTVVEQPEETDDDDIEDMVNTLVIPDQPIISSDKPILTPTKTKKDYLKEYKEMFDLVKMLDEASLAFFFNLRDELRPSSFGQLTLDDIDWERYVLRVEVGKPVAFGLSEISVVMSTGENKELLELLDMRQHKEVAKGVLLRAEDGTLTKDMTAQQCFDVIKEYYEK